MVLFALGFFYADFRHPIGVTLYCILTVWLRR